eukprot:3464562-Amphidinium_carterae.2
MASQREVLTYVGRYRFQELLSEGVCFIQQTVDMHAKSQCCAVDGPCEDTARADTELPPPKSAPDQSSDGLVQSSYISVLLWGIVAGCLLVVGPYHPA